MKDNDTIYESDDTEICDGCGEMYYDCLCDVLDVLVVLDEVDDGGDEAAGGE